MSTIRRWISASLLALAMLGFGFAPAAHAAPVVEEAAVVTEAEAEVIYLGRYDVYVDGEYVGTYDVYLVTE